jgi:hypothetical protein
MTAPVLAITPPTELAQVSVDVPRRRIEGLVVPYGEPGRTNLGPCPIRAGAVQLGGLVIGTFGHNRELPVARMAEATDTPAGLRMAFSIAPTPLGDQLLAEASPEVGVRSGLSIELSDMRFDPITGECVYGLCEFVAFVPIGAYASARVTSVAAHVHQEGTSLVTMPQGQPAQQQQNAQPAQAPGWGYQQAPAQQLPPAQPVQQAQQAPAQQLPPAQPVQQAQPGTAPQGPSQSDLMAQAAGQWALQQLLGGAGGYGQAQLQQLPPAQPVPQGHAQAPQGLPIGQTNQQGQAGNGSGQLSAVTRLAQLQAQLHAGQGSKQELYAALSDITASDHEVWLQAQGPAQELWSGGGYRRRFVPLMAPKTLTSYKYQGWRWGVKPKVGRYDGDKAEVPSNKPTTVLVPGEAERLAGAHDIDRKYKDFGDVAFWQGYYEAMTESYAEESDLIAAEALVGMARTIVTDANVPPGYTDVNVAQSDVLRAAALGTAILEDTPNVRRPADWVMMNTSDWLTLLDYTNLDLPAFLALLGVQPGGFQRSNLVPKGAVILGVQQASSFYELGGGAPIRVEAVDVGRAGIDAGVYGYVGTMENRPGGIISVPLVPAQGA